MYIVDYVFALLQENEAKLVAAALEAKKKETEESDKKDNAITESEATHNKDSKDTQATENETVTTTHSSEHSEAAKEESEDSLAASTPLSSPSKSSDQSSAVVSPSNSSPRSVLASSKAPNMSILGGVRGAAGAALIQESSKGECEGICIDTAV